MATRSKPEAVLLLGPTGSGKSPLGNRLERTLLWGRRCHHFDFGASLRAIVAESAAEGFSANEIRFLRDVLQEGALLEKKHFPLAARILHAFLVRRGFRPVDLIVLNGLPRHLEQARLIDRKIAVIAVVQLECDACTARERLRRDTAGDRLGRIDDTTALVARKLALYGRRTRPLLAHYSRKGVPVLRIRVSVESNAEAMFRQLETWPH
jgi:adenylate kinase